MADRISYSTLQVNMRIPDPDKPTPTPRPSPPPPPPRVVAAFHRALHDVSEGFVNIISALVYAIILMAPLLLAIYVMFVVTLMCVRRCCPGALTAVYQFLGPQRGGNMQQRDQEL